MNTKGKSTNKNKISYWNSIFSISTVLFLTGFLGMFIMIAKNTSDVLKESVTIQVELVDTTADTYNLYIQELKGMSEIKQLKFVSKDSAAAKLKKEISEDFISIIGYNPWFNAIEINIKSEFFTPQTLEKVKSKI